MIILITGTSTGIGYSTAALLARNGHTVYAGMRTPEASPRLQQLAEEEKLKLTVLKMDVLKDADVQNAVETVLSKEKRMDVLVNNAGTHAWGAVEELPMDLFREIMETNYFGALRCIKAILPSMRENKNGTIVNISSVAGKMYSNFHGAYSATKAALEALSESLAQEVAPFNIKVFLVQPGITDTPIFNKTNKIPADTHYPNIKRFLSMFAASLNENPISTDWAAETINEIVAGKRNLMRNPAGPDAPVFLTFRSSLTDEDWANSVLVDDVTWIAGMEQMGLPVSKYMQAAGFPRF